MSGAVCRLGCSNPATCMLPCGHHSFPPPAEGWLHQPDDPGVRSFLEACDKGVEPVPAFLRKPQPAGEDFWEFDPPRIHKGAMACLVAIVLVIGALVVSWCRG